MAQAESKRAEMEHRREFIRQALADGRKAKEIAADLGVNTRVVYATVERTPGLSIKPFRKAGDAGKIAAMFGVQVGFISNALKDQDALFVDWLCRNTPRGGTVTDFLISLAVDVYLDEVEQKPASE